jgi:hypothetical protein
MRRLVGDPCQFINFNHVSSGGRCCLNMLNEWFNLQLMGS